MSGGFNRGAYELGDPSGRRAVLKWHPPANANHELSATQAMLDGARDAGWATPRWLASGVAADGRQFLIEEFIDDARAARPDEQDLALVLASNGLQAGRGAGVTRDWSRWNWRVVWEDEGGCAAVLRRRPDTAALLARIMAANDRGLLPPNDDLVHGDCTLDNVLVQRGRPVFIDAEHAGRGTRAYDLATMIYVTNVDGVRPAPPDAITDRYVSEGIRLIGKDGFIHCVTSSMIEFIGFGFDHWPSDLALHVARCDAFLDRLGAPRAPAR